MFAHTLDVKLVLLDTNVVLDAWLFHQSNVLPLAEALQAGHVQAIATLAMRNELHTVLARAAQNHGLAPTWLAKTPAAQVLAAWDATTRLVPDPGLTAGDTPRCSDPDDQKFIDLACAMRVPWLLTRDRAVLRLTKRLYPLGVQVATPDAWVRAQA
jgi:uncharacterized protein